MKTNVVKCWYCGAPMEPVDDVWYHCPKCGATYSRKHKDKGYNVLDVEDDLEHGGTKYAPSKSVQQRAKKIREGGSKQ